MSHAPSRPWKPIERLDPALIETNGRLAAVDALRSVWKGQLDSVLEEERVRRRQRSLRRLAIETGVIERLYDIEWGLTLTLVAEGFARDVIERASGRIDDWTLATLKAQRETLEMVIDFVRHDRKLSASFIKELHHAITRTQTHYEATDVLGQLVRRELPRGEWKHWPNHVERRDGSKLEYCPPEHVASEIDNLATWFEELDGTGIHAVVKAAWLHHGFVQIHPFADGNGRVARALTLLVLQRNGYAPLVVDRHHRSTYLAALDKANDGDLHPLVHLFASLESAALASELEQPPALEVGTARDVAHTLAAQIAARRAKAQSDKRNALMVRNVAIFASVEQWLSAKRIELSAVFAKQQIEIVQDLYRARSDQPDLVNGTPHHLFFRRQAIDSAHEAGHYADLGGFVGLLNLRVKLEGMSLSFAVSIHGAGVDSGVMAVTTFAVIRLGAPSVESEDVIDVPTTTDAFYFAFSDSMEALSGRTRELQELLDAGLTVALAELLKRF